jgi:hypothetical protein
MSRRSRLWLGVSLSAAAVLGLTACSGEAGRAGAKQAGKLDAALLGLLEEIDRSRDPRCTQRAVAEVLKEERFVASLLAVLADPKDPHLVAAIRCAGAVPRAQLPAAMEVATPGEETDAPQPATTATVWTDPESPANTRLDPLVLRHLQHREAKARAAALAALSARQQLPPAASDLLEDPDATVRAAAVTACMKLDPPPWPRLAAAWLTLGTAQAETITLEGAAADQLGTAVAALIDWNDTTVLQQQLPLLARLPLPEAAVTQLVATLPRANEAPATAVLTFLCDRARPLADPAPVLAIVTDQQRPASLRQFALRCLEACEAPVVAELQQAMPELDGSLRVAAARVMIRAGSQAGVDALCDVAQSGEESSRGALLLLSRLAGASASTPVEELRSRIAARDLRQLRLP